LIIGSNSEVAARLDIDRMLTQAGWFVCDFGSHDISRPRTIREFSLKQDHGHADYLRYLYENRSALVRPTKPASL
jgi:hypothetical protein